jgi:predicted DNA-binding WGR domain protein
VISPEKPQPMLMALIGGRKREESLKANRFHLFVGGALFGWAKASIMSHARSAQNVQLVVLDRIDDAQNMARYYVLSIEPTLFDEISLVREWSRIGKSGGRRIELHQSYREARIALNVWLSRKRRRGYELRF